MRNISRRQGRRSLIGTLVVACLVGTGMLGGAVTANAAEDSIPDSVEAPQSAAQDPDTDPREELVEQLKTTIESLKANADNGRTKTAAPTVDAVSSGTWGGAPWEFDPSTGILTVAGNLDSTQPWTLSIDQKPWFSSEEVKPGAITKIVLENPDGIRLPANSSYLFASSVYKDRLENLTDIEGLGLVETKGTTNMAGMFSGASSLTVLDVSNWDTSEVTNMSSMFASAKGLTVLDVSNWDTSKVTNMSSMFSWTNLETLDVSNWDTSKVTNMSAMFYAASLKVLDVSNWDTSKVTNMSRMFYATSLKALDVSNWDTSKVTDMSAMFWQARSFTVLDVSNWDTSKVTDMSMMFAQTPDLKVLDVSNWDTSKVTTMSSMFWQAEKLEVLDVSNWDTSEVWTMSEMFESAHALKVLDVSNWDTSKVTNMSEMFWWADNLETLDVSNWDTSKVTNMSRMFRWTDKLEVLDVSNWDTSEVQTMSEMFEARAYYATPPLKKLDVSEWDTSKVTNMKKMFYDAASLKALNLSNWDTSEVWTMSEMFDGATGLESLTLGQNSKLDDDASLPPAPESGADQCVDCTGKWVELDTFVDNEDYWWRGNNSEVMRRSQKGTDSSAGTYVWQRAAIVDFVLGEGGTWPQGEDPVLLPLVDRSSLLQGGVGDFVKNSADPKREGYIFGGWTVTLAPTDPSVLPLDADGLLLANAGTTTFSAQWSKEVTPEVPELVAASECGVEPTVTIPEMVGVEYTEVRDGSTVTVTATPVEGYVIAEGATTEWEFNVAAEACTLGPAFVTPKVPELVPASECGVEPTVTIPEMVGVEYTEVRDGSTVTVIAKATEGYVIAEGAAASWEFNIAAEECEAEENDDFVVVSFDLNGGDGDFRALVTHPDEPVHIYDHAPVREGYEFAGWLPVSLMRDSSGMDDSGLIKPGTDHVPFGNTIFRAQWEQTSVDPVDPPTEPTVPGGTTDPTDPAGSVKPGGSGSGTPAKGSVAAGNTDVSNGLAKTGGEVTPFAFGAAVLLLAGLGLFSARRGRTRG